MKQKCVTLCFIIAPFFAAFSQGLALEPEQIWELVSPSCVRVEATQLDGTKSLGTGFAFEMEGKKYILSSRHVVLGASQVQIGQSATNLVQVASYRISPSLDFAIIDLPESFKIAAAKKRLSALKTGERAYAIGFPLGLNKSITQGLVNSHSSEYVQFDAAISSGNSGGPLVDKDGAVIGVVTAGSRPNASEVVQNLNLAINIAYVPKAGTFVDPIVSFYDAWLKLVEFETRLLSGLEHAEVLDLDKYLKMELGTAMYTAAELNQAGSELEAMRNTLIKKIKASYQDVDSAIPASVTFLRRRAIEFDEIPKLFIGLGHQRLLEEFINDKRPGGLFRLNIKVKDIVPLLTVSLEHAKAAYEDMAYQLDFIGRNRSRLANGDAAFRAQLRRMDEKAGTLRRTAIRISYPAEPNLISEDSQLTFLILSMVPFSKTKESAMMLLEDKKLTAEQDCERFGGFEQEILGMFQRLAAEQIQKGNLDQALGFIRNETTHRKFPAWRIEAHILVCRGEFEDAYKTYEKALYTSKNKVDPFTLEGRDGMDTAFILGEVSNEQDGFWSYTKAIQENWKEWNRFIFNRGELSMADAASPREVFASQAFARLSDFEKARIIYHIKTRALGDKFSSFFNDVRGSPAAREVYENYF
jgi:Trypsin-like peptidase domain